MNESSEALRYLLENVDEATGSRLQAQKEVIEKQEKIRRNGEDEDSTSTEPSCEEDLSPDQLSEHSDSEEEGDHEEQLKKQHEKIREIIERKTQERKEREQRAHEFVAILGDKNDFDYNDFENLSEALRLNLQPRRDLISALAYFVAAMKENKMASLASVIVICTGCGL